MPYRKQYRKRRRPRRGGAGYLSTASKALAVAYSVKQLLNVEYHTITTQFTVDPSSSGAVVNLTAIAQGDDIDNRQGNKIRAKYISIRGLTQRHASATNSFLRMMVIRDNNGSTTQPAIADLFSTVAVFAQNENKLGDPQSNSRFSILWDKYVIFDSTSRLLAPVNWTSSLDHHIFYTGTAATNEGKGNIYLFIASNEATNDPVVNVNAMVKYLDN